MRLVAKPAAFSFVTLLALNNSCAEWPSSRWKYAWSDEHFAIKCRHRNPGVSVQLSQRKRSCLRKDSMFPLLASLLANS